MACRAAAIVRTQTLFDLVGLLAGGRALPGRQAGDGPQKLGENPLAAEVLDVQRLDGLGVRSGRFQLGACIRINLIQIQFHNPPP